MPLSWQKVLSRRWYPQSGVSRGSWPDLPQPTLPQALGSLSGTYRPAFTPTCPTVLRAGSLQESVWLWDLAGSWGGLLGLPTGLCPLPELARPTRAASAQILLPAPRVPPGAAALS